MKTGRTAPVVFFGTPPFAVPALRAVLASGRPVALVVTRPDRPKGRGLETAASAVKEAAEAAGLEVVTPRKMGDLGFIDQLRSAGSPLFVVAAYGRILPGEVLSIPALSVNVHASLLPRWRGAAPIQRSILSGDLETGVSIMRVVAELDAGDVCLTRRLKIGPDESAGELESRLADAGAEALIEALDAIDTDSADWRPQDPGQVTLAPPVRAGENRIDWSASALEVHNRVRAFKPKPGAFTTDGRGRIKIHRTALTGEEGTPHDPPSGSLRIEGRRLYVYCGRGRVEIVELQREGRSRQAAASFLAGYRPEAGARWM